jgi:hypothetical protein
VRWSNLTLDGDEQRQLPGYRDPAAVRCFDAPEALDMRFYEVHAKSVLNRVPKQSRMPFRWTINPYRGCSHACTFCFARPTHTFLGFNPGRDFEREIVVKVNAPEVLRVELARASWKGEHVALGTNTDPYQWVEGRYRLMVGIWEALRDAANPCSVLTKSPLLLRDLPLMLEIAQRASFSACLSIPTLDEKAWRATEPHTKHRRRRTAPARRGAHGFMDWLRSQRPDLVSRYEELYRRSAYAPPQERARLARTVRRGAAPGSFWRADEQSEDDLPSDGAEPVPVQRQQSLF